MAWTAFGGVDIAEAQLYALHRLADHADAGFRAESAPIIVWFGDAPGHDQVCDEISGDAGHDRGARHGRCGGLRHRRIGQRVGAGLVPGSPTPSLSRVGH